MNSKQIIIAIVVIALSISFIGSLPNYVCAKESEINVAGKVFEFDDNIKYMWTEAEGVTATEDNTYGHFSIVGEVSSDGKKDGVVSFNVVNSEETEKKVRYVYSYTDSLLNAAEDEWHLVSDNCKTIDSFALEEKIQHGALVLLSSKDGSTWSTKDVICTNVFKEKENEQEEFYSPKSIQINNGTFFRLIVAYELGRKTGEKTNVFGTVQSVYEYKRCLEVYDFFIHGEERYLSQEENKYQIEDEVLSTKKDNGFADGEKLTIKDPHYSWTLGEFWISGFTKHDKDDDKGDVFLKNVNDRVVLWFNLTQDIDQLNGDETLTINDDNNGYDEYFQINKTDMGRGTLIIQYTDYTNKRHDPIIYENFLEAVTKTGADTVVQLFEEGYYEVALDYEIKKSPREVLGIDVLPEIYSYRIFFKFAIFNGNVRLFMMEANNQMEPHELTDGSSTESGFTIDLARARYLDVEVSYSVINFLEGGTFKEEMVDQQPSTEGKEYTEEGIYRVTASNDYVREPIVKTIYIIKDGEFANILRAMAKYGYSIDKINEVYMNSGIIKEDGTISYEEESKEEMSSQAEEESTESTSVGDSNTSGEDLSAENLENNSATRTQESGNNDRQAANETIGAGLNVFVIGGIILGLLLIMICVSFFLGRLTKKER